MKHPLKNKTFRRKYHANYLKSLDKRQRTFLAVLRQYFNDQRDRLLTSLDGKSIKNIIDDEFNEELEVLDLVATARNPLKKIVIDSGDETLEIFGFNEPFVFTSEINKWFENRLDIFSRQINKTTFDQLQSDFKDSIEANEGLKELKERIARRYDQIEDGRALTIARTEVHGMTQKASLEAYRQVDLPIKIWVAVFDNTRDSHAMMDGQEVKLDDPFISGLGNKLMFPGDSGLGAGPEDTINCQCNI